MKHLKYILINASGLICLLFIGQSCRHKSIVNTLDGGGTPYQYKECDPVDTRGTDPSRIIDYYQERVCVSKPCFNPNNPDEFVYFKFVIDPAYITKQYVIHNIKTGKEFVVLDDPDISEQVKWAKSNWIVFMNRGAVLYKIKTNGDSLTQLTFCLAHYELEVSPDGKMIMATDRYSSENKYRGDKFISIDGERLDSTPFNNGGNGYKTWNTDNIIATCFEEADNTYLGFLNYKTKEFKKTIQFSSSTNRNILNGICWHPNNSEVFCCNDSSGLIKVNVNTLTSTTIKNGCYSRKYGAISVSPDGKRMLVDKTIYWFPADKKYIHYQSNIYIMDIDGKNEEKVL